MNRAATSTEPAPALQTPGMRLDRALRATETACAGATGLLGFVVGAAWLAGGPRALQQPLPGAAPMVFNTALLFLVASGALLLAGADRRRTASATAAFCVVVAGLILIEYSTGTALGIDELFVGGGEWAEVSDPGRMAPNTAAAFLVSALALLAIVHGQCTRGAILASTSLAIGVVAAAGYVAGYDTAYGWGPRTRMAPHTAAAHVLLAAGLVALAWRRQAVHHWTRIPWLGALCGIGSAVVVLLSWQALDAQLQRQWHDSLERRATTLAEIAASRLEFIGFELARLADLCARDARMCAAVWPHEAAFTLRILPPESGVLLLDESGRILASAGIPLPPPAKLGPLDEPPPRPTPVGPHATRVHVAGDRVWLRIAVGDAQARRTGAVAHFPLSGFAAADVERSRRLGLQIAVAATTETEPLRAADARSTVRLALPAPLDMLTLDVRDTRPIPGARLATLLLSGGLAGALLIGALISQTQRQREARLLAEDLARQLERINLDLGTLAATDPLTGVPNRRQFEHLARNALLAVQRRPGGLGLLALDLDHFKHVNDNYGHAAGDRALRAVVTCMLPLLRPLDVLGRLGGEEFGVLLPETAPADAMHVAERLCEAVRHCDVQLPEGKLRLTITVGVATCPHDGATLEAVMARADERLYAAKAAGRDRVLGADAPA